MYANLCHVRIAVSLYNNESMHITLSINWVKCLANIYDTLQKIEANKTRLIYEIYPWLRQMWLQNITLRYVIAIYLD